MVDILPVIKELLADLEYANQEEEQPSGAYLPDIDDNDDSMIVKPSMERRVVPKMLEIFDYLDMKSKYSPVGKDYINITKMICNVAKNSDKYDKDFIYYEFLPTFSGLFNDAADFIRESAVKAISGLAKCFGSVFTEKFLLPHLINLSKDEIEEVRGACVHAFAEMAPYCSIDVRKRQLTECFITLVNEESQFRPQCAKELGLFIYAFADPIKTGLIMRDGEIINLNQKRHRTRRRGRLSSRKILSSTSSQHSHLNEMPPPDPESKTSISSLQIQSPGSGLSVSDNEFSAKDSSRFSSSSSTSDFNSEDEEDTLFLEDLPVSIPSQLDDRYSEAPPGFEAPARQNFLNSSKFKSPNSSVIRDILVWEQFDPDFMDPNDEDDEMNSSFIQHDDIDADTEDPQPSEEAVKNENINSLNYWALNIELDDNDIAQYSKTSHIEQKTKRTSSPIDSSSSIKAADKLLEEFASAVDAIDIQMTGSSNKSFSSVKGSPSNTDISENRRATNSSSRLCEFLDNVTLLLDRDPLLNEKIERKCTLKSIEPTLVPPLIPPLNLKNDDEEEEKIANQPLKSEIDSLLIDSNSENADLIDKDSERSLKKNPPFMLSGGKGSAASLSFLNFEESFWSKNFLQKTTESMKKTTATIQQSAENLTNTSSALFAKLRLPPSAVRLLSPSPRKLYKSKSPVRKEITPLRPPSIIGDEGRARFLTEEEQKAFMATGQDVIPQQLLDTLVSLQRDDYKKNDSLRHQNIAESFPAIVYTFSASGWIYIKAIYMSFCVHKDPQVRMKMAKSIHQIAKVLGPKLAEKDLCPVFRSFAKDIEIQNSLLTNLYSFIKAMPGRSQQVLAAELNVFNTYDINNKWRLRYEFIQQLTKLVTLFRPYEINNFLVPFALAFSADKIADIRLSAMQMLALILAIFIRYEHTACKLSGLSISSPNSMPLSEKLLEEIKNGFWRTKNWRRRQTFAIMMQKMLENELISRKKFCYVFKPFLIELAAEDISNIRQYFCRIIEFLGRDRLETIDNDLNSIVLTCLHQMAASDKDLEIRMMARVVLGTMDRTKSEIDLSRRIAHPQTAT